MADLGEDFVGEAVGRNATPTVQPAPSILSTSALFKGEGKAATALRRRASMKPNLEVEEFINLLHGSAQ
ncbi:hypothetical protein Cni_G19970 [Canna indica]|uniref:Uncharacterized protein n=1 Tax=Canna indica TaxID=4628 RepID=A0AAQ3KLM7_9LILI|nr:hypothetical protein Cni_G19970 [Canna indica]